MQYNYKTKPFKYQQKLIEDTVDKRNYAIFWEMRLGKSKVVLDTFGFLVSKDEVDCLLILAPAGSYTQWIKEAAAEHLNLNYDGVIYTNKDEKNFKNLYNDLTEKPCVIVFPTQGLTSKKQQEWIKKILDTRKCLFVIDESHHYKANSQRTKFIIDVGRKALYRRILTGTPIEKGPHNLFYQMKFLDWAIIGQTSFFAFQRKYCQMGGWMDKQILGSKNEEELMGKIKEYSSILKKKDVFDLPERLYITKEFIPTDDQIKHYNSIKEEGLALFGEDDGRLYQEVLARMQKLSQLSSGFLLDGDKVIKLVEDKDNPKLQLLLEILEQLSEKTIIWTKYKEEFEMLKRVLGKDTIFYEGDKEKNEFKNNSDINNIVISISKGAEGLTLTEAKNAIYFNNDYSFLKREQSEARNHDINSKENVTYFDLLGTPLDKKILKILKNKRELNISLLKSDNILGDEND
jgi:SNF2 family DNA or RNA helicase